MARFNVYGVCDWPEEMGETFVIFVAKEFPDADAAAAAAHGAESTRARNLAATCTACHVKGGAGVAAIRPLDGTHAAQVRSALLAYKSGQRTGSVMPQLARGYSDAEIDEITAWFAAQHP